MADLEILPGTSAKTPTTATPKPFEIRDIIDQGD